MLRRLVSIPVCVLMWPFQVAENRRVLSQLAALDDRGLADIGLYRQDLRDMTALPRGADASLVLAGRASERAARAERARPAPPRRMAAE
jgi:uncharacterized protein YjiS (DUF1127 family)